MNLFAFSHAININRSIAIAITLCNVAFGLRITDFLTMDVFFIIDELANCSIALYERLFLTEIAVPSKPTFFIVYYTVTIFIYTHTYTPSQVSARSIIY